MKYCNITSDHNINFNKNAAGKFRNEKQTNFFVSWSSNIFHREISQLTQCTVVVRILVLMKFSYVMLCRRSAYRYRIGFVYITTHHVVPVATGSVNKKGPLAAAAGVHN